MLAPLTVRFLGVLLSPEHITFQFAFYRFWLKPFRFSELDVMDIRVSTIRVGMPTGVSER